MKFLPIMDSAENQERRGLYLIMFEAELEQALSIHLSISN